MKTSTRRHTHKVLAWFFLAQVPIALYAQFFLPDLFSHLWRTYLIFLSLYAVVSTHWAGAAAETPTKED
ncbi:MAG: hypothetical protein M3P43_02240 [Actinomycetota bacterium]|nr:hypothetical protein [Actinomycetota bacterium]